ncbi:flavin reductase family protein [Actinomadura sp. WMMB 499]|uniref:flavin reductase family protein n=1 Tax=Actinomadura sp. WMMB 499 TaxID=1219491 RepID=UPI00124659CB|nr:flavin reductase family protein [Actinomadura sp. WMMB 499]QFG20218.1 flavin reductase family protein [Actinomadura sp. WMMB 499]
MTARRSERAAPAAPARGPETVSGEDFRSLIGRFTTGVTIVTTVDGGVARGTTASALSSVSLEPPTLLICMNKESTTGRAITRSGHFAVNVLGEDQGAVARHFARSGSGFGEYATVPGRWGSPLLVDALAGFECRVTDAVEAGTHIVMIGAVESAVGREGLPLAYFCGRFGRLSLGHPE